MEYNFKSYKIHYLIIVFFFSFGIEGYSQKYSEYALTGRGDLILVGDSFKLQKPVYEAFLKMKSAALKEGILIQAVSSYRSYNHQKNIWNRKYNKYLSEGFLPKEAIEEIIKYSTLPGTSRHHWGTDIDIIDGMVIMPKNILLEENYNAGGVYYKLKTWMDLNSEKFGFHLVYDNSLTRKGFKYEPWHYSYKKISQPMLKDFSLINLNDFFETKKLNGVKHFTEDFLGMYLNRNVFSINNQLR